MQTNLSMQIVQTRIWATRSTSKEESRGSGRGICKILITQSKGGQLIVNLPNPPWSLDVDPVAQIGVCTVLHEVVDLHLICSHELYHGNTTLSKMYLPLIRVLWWGEINLPAISRSLRVITLEKILKLQLHKLMGLNFFILLAFSFLGMSASKAKFSLYKSRSLEKKSSNILKMSVSPHPKTYGKIRRKYH